MYLKIFHNIYISNRGAIAMLSTVWISSLGIPLVVPIAAGGVQNLGLVIQVVPSMNGCLTTFHDPGPVSRGLAIFVIATIVLSCGANSYINFTFLFNYLQAGNGKSMPEERNEREIRLVKRTIILSSALLVFWGPSGFALGYQIISGNPVSPLLDGVLNIFILLNPATNPLLLYYFDPVIGKYINDHPLAQRFILWYNSTKQRKTSQKQLDAAASVSAEPKSPLTDHVSKETGKAEVGKSTNSMFIDAEVPGSRVIRSTLDLSQQQKSTEIVPLPGISSGSSTKISQPKIDQDKIPNAVGESPVGFDVISFELD
jgi:hypothetical protein